MATFQHVQLKHEGDLISDTNPVPTSSKINGHICDDNSSTVNIAGDASFTGVWQDTLNYNVIIIGIKSDQDSATDGLDIQWSGDGVNIHDRDAFTITADSGKVFTFSPARRYLRIVYTNGSTPTTSFSLQTIFKKGGFKASSHRIQDSIVSEDDAELVKAVITGENPAGTFVNFQSTTRGNFKVSLEEFENDVSTNSNTQLKTTLYDEGGIPISVDDSTETLQVIDYAHHEVHSGSHYYVQGYQDLAINHVLQFTMVTPNTTKWPHWTFKISTESETLWQVYEGGVINNELANTITPNNNNRNSTNTSGVVMKYEDHANLAGANTDVSVAGATLLSSGISGAGKESGEAQRANEVILKQNTVYVFRAIATAAGYINFDMDWYEHTDKN